MGQVGRRRTSYLLRRHFLLLRVRRMVRLCPHRICRRGWRQTCRPRPPPRPLQHMHNQRSRLINMGTRVKISHCRRRSRRPRRRRPRRRLLQRRLRLVLVTRLMIRSPSSCRRTLFPRHSFPCTIRRRPSFRFRRYPYQLQSKIPPARWGTMPIRRPFVFKPGRESSYGSVATIFSTNRRGSGSR